MAIIFFQIFTENNPASWTGRIYNIPDVNWLNLIIFNQEEMV